MKKTYVSPLTNEVNVMTETIIAASVKMGTTTVNSKGNSVQLGNTQRGEWGNLWSK